MMQKMNHLAFLGMASVAVILVAGMHGCGGKDDSAPSNTGKGSYQAPKTEHKPQVVTSTEHQNFEKRYIEKCVQSQHKDLSSDFTNDQELNKVCSCMATEISKRISKADATHFLQKNEFPFDLVMMTNAASNICLSKK
jgi:hypothetical protein